MPAPGRVGASSSRSGEADPSCGVGKPLPRALALTRNSEHKPERRFQSTVLARHGWKTIVSVHSRFPILIVPSTLLRSRLQLIGGNAGSITSDSGIILERWPRDGMMIVPNPKKSAEAHHRETNAARDL